jgi:hypothetical protein
MRGLITTRPCDNKYIIDNVGNIKIKSGHFYVKNCERYISVQYDGLIKGNLYEIWNHIDYDEAPRRFLMKKDVKKIIVDVFNVYNN